MRAHASIGWMVPTSLLACMDADEDRAGRDGLPQVIGIDAPESVHRQVGDPCAQALNKPTRFNDCWMFDPRGDDVIATVALCKVHTFEREIVSLAAAAGEDNVILLAPKESRNLSTCFLKRGFGRGRGPMPARRITEVIRKK